MIVDSPMDAKPDMDDKKTLDFDHTTRQDPQSTEFVLDPSSNPPPPYLLPETDDKGGSPATFGDSKKMTLSPPQSSYERSPNLSSTSNDGWSQRSYPRPQNNFPSFEPMFLIAVGQYLTRGFPARAPPSKNDPHPFISHGVPEMEWLRFLAEVKAAGQLSDNQERYSHIPIVSILPIVGSLSTHVIRQQMKKGKTKEVAKVIDNWNHHFFNPRQIHVVLMHGAAKLSGINGHLGSNTSIPSPSIQLPHSEFSTEKGKGKAKEEDDTTYRLFVMPLYTAN